MTDPRIRCLFRLKLGRWEFRVNRHAGTWRAVLLDHKAGRWKRGVGYVVPHEEWVRWTI